jgi:hypothetical protein
MTTSAPEEDMAALARAIRILEGSPITPVQFWTQLNRSRELHFAVMLTLNGCIKKLTAYRDEAPPMPPAASRLPTDL